MIRRGEKKNTCKKKKHNTGIIKKMRKRKQNMSKTKIRCVKQLKEETISTNSATFPVQYSFGDGKILCIAGILNMNHFPSFFGRWGG